MSRYTHVLAWSGEGLSMKRNIAICSRHQAGGSHEKQSIDVCRRVSAGMLCRSTAALMKVKRMVVLRPSTLRQASRTPTT